MLRSCLETKEAIPKPRDKAAKKKACLPAGREKVILKEIATRSPAMPRGVTDF